MIDYKSLIKGSVIPKLTKEDLITIHIPVPSKETQEYIVKECEYYDNLIETLNKENNRLQNNNIIEITLKSVATNITTEELTDNSETKNESQNIEEPVIKTQPIDNSETKNESQDIEEPVIKKKVKKVIVKKTKPAIV